MTTDTFLSTSDVMQGITSSQVALKHVGTDEGRSRSTHCQARPGKGFETVATRTVTTERATYWADLNRKGKESGETFVKLTERSNSNGRRSSLFIGYEDMPKFMQHLKAPKSKVLPTSHVPYADFNSTKIKTKTFHFTMLNASGKKCRFGQEVRVSDVSNIDDEASNDRVQRHVFIRISELDDILQAIESVISHVPKKFDPPEQINEKVEYVVKNSHNINATYFESGHATYLVSLKREKGGKCFVTISSRGKTGPNKGASMYLNISPEDMLEFIEHLMEAPPKSMGDSLSGTRNNRISEFDSSVFNNTFCFSTTDDGDMLKLTKRYPFQQSVQSVIWIPIADVDQLRIAIEKVLSARKPYLG